LASRFGQTSTCAVASRALPAQPSKLARVAVDGKFLSLDGQPFRVRGATYGSFRPREDGELFPERYRVVADFIAIAEAGLNTVRTYTLPPKDVVDCAGEMGLRLIVGLQYDDWRMESHPNRATNGRILDAGRSAVEDALERCAGRPEVMAVVVANEVPADLVRLHGIGSVEETLSELCEVVRASRTGILATYANFPTTEYLHVEGQDVVSFNVFLERPESFRRYLRHLHSIAGERPVVITELGLPADIHGLDAQAESIAAQLKIVEETGCAGATIFSWSDEWGVNDQPISGWGFGLTDVERRPKPALDAVRRWARMSIRDLRDEWPRISVVVCARNEETVVAQCLASLMRCDYPELEVIFCDDGSTDRTLEVARQFPFRVIALEHGGLSNARNAGLAATSGEIVAYLDADAECHSEWPYHLAISLEDSRVAATGGPNLPPADAPFVQRAIAESPGGPVEVLVADDRAEHVPGCNMAFRKEALEPIGGFDPVYTAAGDDVDVCWKLLDSGLEIAFSPTAQTRHQRPESIRAYLRQQRSYGRSERMLHGRHLHRFNRLGQARWEGSIYGGPRALPRLLRPIIYHGPMGFAPFQTVTHRPSEHMTARFSSLLPLTLPLALVGVFAPLSPWFLIAPALALACLVGYAGAIAAGVRPGRDETQPVRFRLLVAVLHVLQPFVRTWGRFRGRPVDEKPRENGDWHGDRVTWLDALRHELAMRHCSSHVGGPHDAWDVVVSVGPFVRCRVTTAVLWGWNPLYRMSLRPRPAAWAPPALAAVLAGLGLDWPALGVVGAFACALVIEGLFVRRTAKRALSATTEGARIASSP